MKPLRCLVQPKEGPSYTATLIAFAFTPSDSSWGPGGHDAIVQPDHDQPLQIVKIQEVTVRF